MAAEVEQEKEIGVQGGNRTRKKKGRAEEEVEVGSEGSCFFFCYSMKYPFQE